MKEICKKILAVSIIFLLIGVGVTSAISIDTKSTLMNKKNEVCRECNEISDIDIVKVKRLLDRVEVYSKLLLVLSRFNPELREANLELSNDISKLTGMVEEMNHPIICAIVDITTSALSLLLIYIINLRDFYPEDNYIFKILNLICTIIVKNIYNPLIYFWKHNCID